MPVDAAWFRRQAEELEKEEAEAKRELADAETVKERDSILARLEKLEAENAELREQKEAAQREAESEEEAESEGEEEAESEDEQEGEKPKMRKGRKHGMVYRNSETGMGEVYTGDDEDDLVPADEDAA